MQRSVYDVRSIQRLPARTGREEIERIIDSGFLSLTSLVIADASGNAPMAASAVLASRQHCEEWLLALMHVHANLSHAMARIMLKVDIDEERARQNSDYMSLGRTREAVKGRLYDARRRVMSARESLERDLLETLRPVKNEPGMDGLLRKHADECRRLRLEVLDQASVAPEVLAPPEGYERNPEWAVKARVIKEPLTEAAQDMIWLTDEDFLKQVGQDVRDPEGRTSGLRHPLLLRRWREALLELASVTAQRIHWPDLEPGAPLPDQAWTQLPGADRGDFRDADIAAKRLRFYEAVRVRLAEQEALMCAVSRQIKFGVERAQRSVENRVRDKLKKQYAEEFALYAALST